MGNNSVPKFIFRLSSFTVYGGVRFRQVLLYLVTYRAYSTARSLYSYSGG